MDSGFKRAILVWHRRSGKDFTTLNFEAKKTQERVGIYYHCLPTYSQGKKVIWDGMTKEGRRFIDAFPKQIVEKINESEMKIELKNGSIWQVIGADSIDRVVGTNPVGIVFSEFSLTAPQVWDFFRPILAENGGWAVFQGTPRGRNHFFDLLNTAKQIPMKWFTQILTVHDTKAISDDVLESERQEIISKNGNDALFRQEYLCSFEAAILGSYYGHLLSLAREQHRIGNWIRDPMKPVFAVWDLGVGDATAIVFVQNQYGVPTIIDSVEYHNLGLPQVMEELKKSRPWPILAHYAPHDIKVREWGSGKSRLETAKDLGIDFIEVPSTSVANGIDKARGLMMKCRISNQADTLLKSLESYARKWDEVRKCFAEHPEHDWTSHSADAFRYLALVEDKIMSYIHNETLHYSKELNDHDFDPFDVI